MSLNVFSVDKRYIAVNMAGAFCCCCAIKRMLGLFQEERRRQLEVKLTIEEQLRLRREEEEEQQRRGKVEDQRELDERRREAAKVIKRFNERVSLRITDTKKPQVRVCFVTTLQSQASSLEDIFFAIFFSPVFSNV